MSQSPARRARRQGPDSSRDQNVPHLAVLINWQGHAGTLHAGIARNGEGTTLCDLPDVPLFGAPLKILKEFPLAARDPNMALYRPDGYRHRATEAWLELNRGCPHCLNVLAQIGREVGYTEIRGLKA